jgi:hypothetical protein
LGSCRLLLLKVVKTRTKVELAAWRRTIAFGKRQAWWLQTGVLAYTRLKEFTSVVRTCVTCEVSETRNFFTLAQASEHVIVERTVIKRVTRLFVEQPATWIWLGCIEAEQSLIKCTALQSKTFIFNEDISAHLLATDIKIQIKLTTVLIKAIR